ncbi:MAG TPA: sugar kinase [Streptosporangiaceae bacterium]|nr:sugar kinase [Streptosporangiaceae bacterium]
MTGAAGTVAVPAGRGGPDVVTFGEALVVFAAPPAVPLASATQFYRTVAGAEFNVAIGLARLGHKVSFIGRVGDDPHGQLVLRALRAERVNTDGLLVDPSAPTGMLVRDAHADRPVTVTYFRTGSAGSRLRAEQVTGHVIRSARILVATGITAALSPSARDAAFAAVQTARDAGVLVAVDPNIRRKLAPLADQLDDLRRLCAFADVVIAGEDEAAAISGISGSDPKVAGFFLDRGSQLVVIKHGVAGAWASDGLSDWPQPAFPVRAVDPVGAGDAFAAGLLSALLMSLPIADALIRAAACGAMAVAVAGDFEGAPTLAEVGRFLEDGNAIGR